MNLFLKRRSIIYGTSLVIVLLLINTALIFYYRASIVSDNQIEEDTNAIVEETKGLLTGIVHRIDLGVRAYGITRNESMLASTYQAMQDMGPAFDTLRTKLASQGFDAAELEGLQRVFVDYAKFNKTMIDSIRAGHMNSFRQMVAEDNGLKVHQAWLKVSDKILAFEEARNTTAVTSFHEAISNMALLQLCTLLIGFPVLLFVVSRITNNDKLQKRLLMSLDENNRKYIFDPGRHISTNDADQVIKSSIDNYREAAEFIKRISNGDFAVRWKGLDENNSALNKDTLAGELMKMLEKLKTVKQEDEKRFWITEGLSSLMVNVRNNQDNIEKLAEESVRYIIKYVRAQQGSLFVVKQDNHDNYLDLAACYAFDRKKHLTKRIEIGSGMIGQAYLEKEITLLRAVPEGYVHITSGLGHATPSCIVIVPMIHHDNVEAILELAAFHAFEEHELTFLQKAAEFIASSLQSIKISESSSLILAESRQKAEELRANEEELRQNMEELAATQEEVQRVLAEVQKKESYLRNLLDASEDSIVTVDQRYTIIHCNKKARDGYRSAGVELDRIAIWFNSFLSKTGTHSKNPLIRHFVARLFVRIIMVLWIRIFS